MAVAALYFIDVYSIVETLEKKIVISQCYLSVLVICFYYVHGLYTSGIEYTGKIRGLTTFNLL